MKRTAYQISLCFIVLMLLFRCGKNETVAEVPQYTDAQRMQRLLINVGLGKTSVDSAHLNAREKMILDSLISISPNDYNSAQRSLGYTDAEYYPLDLLLVRVGMGTINPDSIKLSEAQTKKIDSIITRNPDAFNAVQRRLSRR